jgi:serine/threonine-protein kinase
VEDSDPRARERVGSVLDEKWTLERILGSGGMGAVYAARHRNGARGAVKVLHPELARRDDIRERFLREGYAANRVEHRGAVRVLDDDVVKEGPDEGTAYLVMEILEGESLEARIDRGPPLTEPELLSILDDVLAVLEAAHEHGVVHRDLKPANLFLNKDPAGPGVKVLDFGLARLEEARSVTGVGLALGTPSYMAPEQASGRTTEIDARTDLFALGATAFMILAGRGVHEADGILELVARMGTLPAPKLRTIAPHVGEPLAQIIDRSLEFNRDDRYPSASAMRADVQAAMSALTPAGRPSVDVLRTTMPPSRSRPSRIGGDAPDHGAAVTGMPSIDARPVVEARPAGRRRSFAPMLLVLFVVGGLTLALVPKARDRTGVPGALEGLFAQRDGSAALDDGSALHAESAELGPRASGSGTTTGDASPDADSDDASALALLSDSLDAAAADPSEAADSLEVTDGGDGGADEDDDEEDDADASDVALVNGRDASAPATFAARPAVKKKPRSAPAHGKRFRLPGKKHRRPRR